MREKFESFAKVAQNFAIIFGILGAVGSMIYGLVYGEYDKRVARTTDMGRDYNIYVKNDYLDLVAHWIRHTDQSGDIRKKNQEDMKKIVLSFFENPDNERKYLNVLYFFDVLSVCIEKRSCDKKSALDLFDKTRGPAYENFGFYIFDVRERYDLPSFGAGLEWVFQMEKEKEWTRLF
jgi:hypothetical protein